MLPSSLPFRFPSGLHSAVWNQGHLDVVCASPLHAEPHPGPSGHRGPGGFGKGKAQGHRQILPILDFLLIYSCDHYCDLFRKSRNSTIANDANWFVWILLLGGIRHGVLDKFFFGTGWIIWLKLINNYWTAELQGSGLSAVNISYQSKGLALRLFSSVEKITHMQSDVIKCDWDRSRLERGKSWTAVQYLTSVGSMGALWLPWPFELSWDGMKVLINHGTTAAPGDLF